MHNSAHSSSAREPRHPIDSVREFVINTSLCPCGGLCEYKNCIQSLPCFFPNLLGFCFEGVGLGSPTHEPPLPFSWSSFDPLPTATASQISAAPHRNHKSLGLTNPHPRPSCLPSPSATAPPILTDDNDFRPIYTPHRRGGTRKLRTVRGDALIFGFSLAAEPLQQPRPRGQPRTHADHA